MRKTETNGKWSLNVRFVVLLLHLLCKCDYGFLSILPLLTRFFCFFFFLSVSKFIFLNLDSLAKVGGDYQKLSVTRLVLSGVQV